MPQISESGNDEIPRASHPHVWILTFFLSLFLFLLAWYQHHFLPSAFVHDFSDVTHALFACVQPVLIGAALALVIRISITRSAMLRASLLEQMDRDELRGGPWSATDHFGNHILSYRAPLRYEPPHITQPPDFFSLTSNPEVAQFIREHPDEIAKATPFELQALSWCAFQGTPASITDSHGGVSLFAHSAKVWLAATESFGFGSDPALLAVSHDLGKVTAYARSGDSWTLVSSSHEHFSVIAATHFSSLMDMEETTRRRLINHLIAYSLRKTHKPTDPEAVFNIRSVVRVDSSVSSSESSGSVVPMPPVPAVVAENRKILADAGITTDDSGAVILPFQHSDPSVETDVSAPSLDPLLELDLSDYRNLSEKITRAVMALNINGSIRGSRNPQGIYCKQTGFFVRVFDIIQQLKSEGVALEITPEDRHKSPWQTKAGSIVLTVMARQNWIISSPGRFSSNEGDRGVFNLQSGAKKYIGMVSINPDMIPEGHLSALDEWCFDVDAIR